MISRRRFLSFATLAGVAGFAAWRAWPEQGVFNPCLGPLPEELARHPLVLDAWARLDPTRVWDAHVHLFGDVGAGIIDDDGLRFFDRVDADAITLQDFCDSVGHPRWR